MPVQNQLAVQDLLSVRTHHCMPLFSSKGLFVKVDRRQAVVHDQVWNKLILSMHSGSPLAFTETAIAPDVSVNDLIRSRCFREYGTITRRSGFSLQFRVALLPAPSA